MTLTTNLSLGLDELAERIDDLLAVLGTGQMDSVAYDTAWLVRLAYKYPEEGFGEALTWLQRNQYSDGSWGSGARHYHDRVICTLAATTALCLTSSSRSDRPRIRKGVNYLWRESGRLFSDANDTGNFRALAALLIDEAVACGLDVPRFLYRKDDDIAKKLAVLRDDPGLWRSHPMSFSLEVFRVGLPADVSFVEANGSVGVSPAATVSLLLNSASPSRATLDYLHQVVQKDGGVPNFAPIDTFETAWALNHLRLAGAVASDHPQVKRSLDFLWRLWSPEKGLGVSSYSAVRDLDDTSVAFSILQWAGYPVCEDVFKEYEEDNHFRCWSDEADQSLSVHVRMLAALRAGDCHVQHQVWIDKILTFLRRRFSSGQFGFDKWHISPYYFAGLAVQSLPGIADELVHAHVKWIRETQRRDGGWGYCGRSTPEETAYCLQALILWDHSVERVEQDQLKAAADYLALHLDDRHLPLWIGKCLYTPVNVVRAAILAALYSYMTHGE